MSTLEVQKTDIRKPIAERDCSVDILRVIGTLFVILAHVYPPQIISTIRSFDVCVLVLISGYAFEISYRKRDYKGYVIKRLKRLCIPAYITITAIFITCLLLCILVGREYPYTWRNIVESATFIGGRTGGVGFFWIIRIYLLMALIAPILRRISLTIQSDWFLIVVAISLICVNQLIYLIFWENVGVVGNFILENYVMSLLAYSSVYLIGVRIAQSKQFLLKALIVFVIGAFITQTIAWSNGGYIVSEYKYPPQAYYIVFGLGASLLLWYFVKVLIGRRGIPSVITWLSQNSFNIYLIHAYVLLVMGWGSKYLEHISVLNYWYVKFIIILAISIIGAIIINTLLSVINRSKQERRRS